MLIALCIVSKSHLVSHRLLPRRSKTETAAEIWVLNIILSFHDGRNVVHNKSNDRRQNPGRADPIDAARRVCLPGTCAQQAHTRALTLPLPLPLRQPKWQDNVDYEEGRERVHGQLRSGYPRFVYHASVKRVFAICERASAGPGEKAIVFASRKVAEHCRLFVLDQAQDATADVAVKVVTHRFTDDVVLHAVVFPAQVAVTAKRFWQHSGEVISSRLAEFAVREGRPLDEEEEIDRYVEEHYGRNLSWNSANAARNALRRRISDVSGEKKTNVYLYATGMAAIYNAHRILRLWRPEGHVVLFGFAYLDTLKVLQKFGKVHTLINE